MLSGGYTVPAWSVRSVLSIIPHVPIKRMLERYVLVPPLVSREPFSETIPSRTKYCLVLICCITRTSQELSSVSFVPYKCHSFDREDWNIELEYLVSPAIHATKIPPGLSPDTAAPLLCGMSNNGLYLVLFPPNMVQLALQCTPRSRRPKHARVTLSSFWEREAG
jgi:hypothetical protein